MPDIGDRAAAPEKEVVLAPESAGAYRLDSLELVPAEQVGEMDGFPEFGMFVAAQRVRVEGSASNEPVIVGGEDVLLEIPLVLEQELDKQGAEPGDTFSVAQPRKAEGGRWIMDVNVGVSAEDLV